MKGKFCWICFFSICITLSQAKRWNTNKDSIIVDAQYTNDEADELQSDDVAEKAECYTSVGEPGECVRLIRCHPILFSEKGQLRNFGLALTYAQTEDVCSAKNTLDGSIEKQSGEADSQIGQKVICCSKDRIQYDLRSEITADLETYSTTLSSDVVEIDTTTGASVVVEHSSNTVSTVEDDVVVVDSERYPEPVVDVEVETAVTTHPTQPSGEIEEPVAEPEVDAVADILVSTQAPQVIANEPVTSPTGTESDGGGSELGSEPETVPEGAIDEQASTSNCPSANSYGPWPVFNDYPWLATIQTRAKTGPTCSGSLITESHVLSAAHCIHRFNSRDVARMQIRIGFTKRSTNDTFNDYYVLRNASKIIFHKRFHQQSKMDNNIALIKLDEPVEFDDHIAPIGVFNGLGGFDVGNCSAAEAGWIKFGNRRVTGISQGVIQFVEPPTSDFHLRESLSRVLNNEECNIQLNSQINEKMLCARSTIFEEPSVSTDFFRWNDGGPLVVKVGNVVQQIGIKSWAYEGQQYPTVYTKVNAYLDWIRNNLKM